MCLLCLCLDGHPLGDCNPSMVPPVEPRSRTQPPGSGGNNRSTDETGEVPYGERPERIRVTGTGERESGHYLKL